MFSLTNVALKETAIRKPNILTYLYLYTILALLKS